MKLASVNWIETLLKHLLFSRLYTLQKVKHIFDFIVQTIVYIKCIYICNKYTICIYI